MTKLHFLKKLASVEEKISSKTIIPIVIAISVLVIATAMLSLEFDSQPQAIQSAPQTGLASVDKKVSEFFEGTNTVKKISSQEDLEGILKTSLSLSSPSSSPLSSLLLGGSLDDDNRIPQSPVATDENTVTTDENTAIFEMMDKEQDGAGFATSNATSNATIPGASVSQSGYGFSTHSTTNIRVENVDEPDYLKNDSKYVYIVSQNTLSIIDAYPAESAKLILKTELDIGSQYIQTMFLNGDRLIIFYTGESDDGTDPKHDSNSIPRQSYSPVTHALIMDVSNKEHPTITKDYSIDGYFVDARMIGDYTYFVTNSNIDYQHPVLPRIMENSINIMTPNAFYFDHLEKFSNFNTLTAIDIFGDKINSESFLMGHSGTFYVSEDSFYLAYLQNRQIGFAENSSQDKFFDTVLPLLPNNVQEQVKAIQNDSTVSSTSQWVRISELIQESYNQMEKNDKENLFETIRKALNDNDDINIKIQKDSEKTIIHKISIDKDRIEYTAQGSVPGRLPSQLAMDENADRLRVVTTMEHHTEDRQTVRTNAVHILDEQLNIVGELDGIAPDESIFSAQFMGDRLYLTTFQQTEPFFVIDLSSDTPKRLGELRIPAFSNYLYPYDEQHVIGFGRDTKGVASVDDLGFGMYTKGITGGDNTTSQGEGAVEAATTYSGSVEQLGLKIGLFNVADVKNPKIIYDIMVWDDLTHSEALYNHKAFFFDKESGVLSVPISGDAENLNRTAGSKIIHTPDHDQWSGFYVFDLDKTDGFVLKGTVDHYDENSQYYGMHNARTFHIGDVLYTASGGYLKMNSLNSLDEINSIKLENTEKYFGYLDDTIVHKATPDGQ